MKKKTQAQGSEKTLRASWSGSLSFGLVHIPIKLYNATADHGLQFKLLDKHGNCPISYLRVCRANHQEVAAEDIVKGYEYKKGDYVVLDEADFKKASPQKTGAVDVLHFCDPLDIDPKLYEKPYYIAPEKKSAKAYLLFRDALRETGKVAIVEFTMKDRQHLGVIIVADTLLVLIELRYQDEIKSPSDISMPRAGRYTAAEMKAAIELVRKQTARFDPSLYKDSYTEELEEIIDAKVKGKKAKTKPQTKAPTPTDMKDLMKLLKKSLERELVGA